MLSATLRIARIPSLCAKSVCHSRECANLAVARRGQWPVGGQHGAQTGP